MSTALNQSVIYCSAAVLLVVLSTNYVVAGFWTTNCGLCLRQMENVDKIIRVHSVNTN